MLILLPQESRERIARYEREMQVRESSASPDTDSMQLLDVVLKIERDLVSSQQRK
jgi:hypothetical protein